MNHERVYRMGGGVIAAAFLLLLPMLFPQILVHLSTEILFSALFAVSFNLLFGYSGLLPFGHAAFFGLGAYVSALIFNHLPQVPLLLALFLSALAGLLAGIVIGFFCVRLSGAYFSLATLAFQMFLFAVALKWRSVTGGDDGISLTRPELYLPLLGSFPMSNIHNLYYLTLMIVSLGILACYFFLETPLGNSVLCMRENDIRASFLGYNVFLTKLAVFSAAGFLAALAGGLVALFQGFVATSCIDMNVSLTVVLMVVIGGPEYFLGPVMGAAFYFVFQNWISSLTKHWSLFMGIFFVVVVLFLKQGLMGLFKFRRVSLGKTSR